MFRPAVRDNEPPPASPPASFPVPTPKACPGVLIILLMRAELFNELFAGLGTVTVTPHVPKCDRPRGPGSPSAGTELSGQQMDGEIARLLMLMFPQDIVAMLGLNRTQGLSFSFKDIPFLSHSAVSYRSQKLMETWAGWPLTPAQGPWQLSFQEQRDREATEPQTKSQQGN